MWPFELWADLASVFVAIEARRCGFAVVKLIHSTSRRSRYLKLRRADGVRCAVRLSDHRPWGHGCNRRLFSVRQRGGLRLVDLRRFLQGVTSAGW